MQFHASFSSNGSCRSPAPEPFIPVGAKCGISVSIIPLYVEPLPFSGERLLVGVVVQSEEQTTPFVLRCISRLEPVFGPVRYQNLVNTTSAALNALTEALESKGVDCLQHWNGAVEGAYLGKPRRARARNVQDAAMTALSEMSFLFDEYCNLSKPAN